MSSLAQWCFKGRSIVIGAWVALLVVLVAAVVSVGTAFTDTTDVPSSESTQAYALLAQTGASGAETGRVVWRTDGSIDARAVQRDVTRALDEIATLPGVEAVSNPYDAKAPGGMINAAKRTAYADVTVTDDVDIDRVAEIADGLESPSTQVAIGGAGLKKDPEPSHGTEVIGVLAALILLFVMFRSMWAAVLPILTGLVGVGVSTLAVLLASNVIDLPATSLTMGALIGLGVGIDYALLIVNRHRKALVAGKSLGDAIAEAIDTSGRAVIFAGLTVIVALLGMYVVGLSVLTGMGQAAAVTVLFTVLAAITLLPALLGRLGDKVLSRRQRDALRNGRAITPPRRRLASGWVRIVQGAPLPVALVALLVIGALAVPVLSMRVGDADPSSDLSGTPTRTYADLMADGFGKGVDATLVLVAKTPDTATERAFDTLVANLEHVDGVAAANASAPANGISIASVTPTTSGQAEETQDLVHTLRDDVIPAAEGTSPLQVYVGGKTATDIDIADQLMGKLPLYLGIIAVLGFLLLAVAFRSLVVPLVGALSNLATLCVGMGAVTAIFQFGWGSELLNVGSGAPIMYIVPVILVGVMFGLAMDYQVFLVSRIHEEWEHTHDNRRAIRVGLTETAPVIATAALIMLCVFASFGLSGERIVSAIGIGLALAVFVDAFLIRMTLVPALMSLLGLRNWWYPRWADRITPRLSIEGATPEHDAPTVPVRDFDVHDDVTLTR